VIQQEIRQFLVAAALFSSCHFWFPNSLDNSAAIVSSCPRARQRAVKWRKIREFTKTSLAAAF
jgi:hypothetical protein